MTLINFFKKYWLVIYLITSFILGLLLALYYPNMIIKHTVSCDNQEIKVFDNKQDAIEYYNNCNIQNNISYININNNSFYNGIK